MWGVGGIRGVLEVGDMGGCWGLGGGPVVVGRLQGVVGDGWIWGGVGGWGGKVEVGGVFGGCWK